MDKMHKNDCKNKIFCKIWLFSCICQFFFVILQLEKCGADERYMSICKIIYRDVGTLFVE